MAAHGHPSPPGGERSCGCELIVSVQEVEESEETAAQGDRPGLQDHWLRDQSEGAVRGGAGHCLHGLGGPVSHHSLVASYFSPPRRWSTGRRSRRDATRGCSRGAITPSKRDPGRCARRLPEPNVTMTSSNPNISLSDGVEDHLCVHAKMNKSTMRNDLFI